MNISGVSLRIGLLAVLLLLQASPALAQGSAAPVNDNRAAAQVLGSLPASVKGTTVGATVEANEPASGCPVPLAGSVWYSVTPATAERIALGITASGNLDAAVDVYLMQRSQLQPVACEQTDRAGMAATSFTATAGATYLIRVAPLSNSSPGGFSLDVFVPQKAASPPGPQLAPGGAEGVVDRVQNIARAYSTTMSAGQTYRINLANETNPGCVSLSLYPPGTTSFDSGTPVLRIPCGGYRLFTPGAGSSGRYSFLVTPAAYVPGPQQYHLQSAPAGAAETAPGQFIGNYAKVSGVLDGNRVNAVRLFSFDVVQRSDLTLLLAAPDGVSFNLQLLNDKGHAIACQCGQSGSVTLQHQLSPGRFFALVRASAGARGRFTLRRQSRTITRTHILIAGRGMGQSSPGQTVPIGVGVGPHATGPATVTIERFDPASKWQYFRTVRIRISNGSGSVSFLPPASGRWRATAAFGGTRTASPSATGFASLLVAGPLRQ